MRIMGIDPGLFGACSVVDSGKLTDHLLMPVHELGKDRRVNARTLHKWIYWANPDHIMIEKVTAMPGNGVTSMFNFGVSFGIVIAVVENLRIPFTLIHPKDWKKKMGLINQPKDATRVMAQARWPEVRNLKFVGKGQAIADAAYIALSYDPTIVTMGAEDEREHQ